MAVEIDIDGNRVTLNDVATEETLKRLLDVMERQGGNSSGTSYVNNAAETIKNTTKANKKLTVELNGLTKSADDLAEELDIDIDDDMENKEKINNKFDKATLLRLFQCSNNIYKKNNGDIVKIK